MPWPPVCSLASAADTVGRGMCIGEAIGESARAAAMAMVEPMWMLRLVHGGGPVKEGIEGRGEEEMRWSARFSLRFPSCLSHPCGKKV